MPEIRPPMLPFPTLLPHRNPKSIADKMPAGIVRICDTSSRRD